MFSIKFSLFFSGKAFIESFFKFHFLFGIKLFLQIIPLHNLLILFRFEKEKLLKFLLKNLMFVIALHLFYYFAQCKDMAYYFF